MKFQVEAKQVAEINTTEVIADKLQNGNPIFFSVRISEFETMFAELDTVRKTAGKTFAGSKSYLVKNTPVEVHVAEIDCAIVALQFRLRKDKRGLNIFVSSSRYEDQAATHYISTSQEINCSGISVESKGCNFSVLPTEETAELHRSLNTISDFLNSKKA